MKKTLIIFILLLATLPHVSFAQTPPATTPTATTQTIPTNYTLLAPIPLGGSQPVTSVNVGTGGIQTYVVDILDLIYGMAAVLAIIVIIIGGIQYMSTDAISGKSDGKKRITDALWGLLLVMCSWIILYTINPNLVNLSLLSGDVASAPQEVTTTTPTATTYTLSYEDSSGNVTTTTYTDSQDCINAMNAVPSLHPGAAITAACTSSLGGSPVGTNSCLAGVCYYEVSYTPSGGSSTSQVFLSQAQCNSELNTLQQIEGTTFSDTCTQHSGAEPQFATTNSYYEISYEETVVGSGGVSGQQLQVETFFDNSSCEAELAALQESSDSLSTPYQFINQCSAQTGTAPSGTQ